MNDISIETTPKNFIVNKIEADLTAGRCQSIVTRFPPEPNGYLHIGHAKAICLNYSLAEQFNGTCHLRFDDTNPTRDYAQYVEAIKADIDYLGFDFHQHTYFASDYFDQLYDFALHLIDQGLAYVDAQDAEQMRAMRGTLTEPGQESPDRNRSIAENRDLFERMRAGKFAEGQYTLRAKIDMASGNMNLRDPVLYRILKVDHPRTGDKWCIYPMYDFTHPLSDAIEQITHSLCSLEFQDHRPLYDWCIANTPSPSAPEQTEFSRLNLNYTITSKRKLKTLVDEGKVTGWDDPRMPTLSGMRTRGYPAKAIVEFCKQIGISKQDSVIDMNILEGCVRNELNHSALRRMAILDPIKVIISNMADDENETMTLSNHPQRPELGDRPLNFNRHLYIDRSDVMLEPIPGFRRLSPGKHVRLLNAYVIRCDEVVQDEQGEIVELICHLHRETLRGKPLADGPKVKGVIQWLPQGKALDCEVRIYDRLFKEPNPAALDDFMQAINPDSLTSMAHAKVEPSVMESPEHSVLQFVRVGYFALAEKTPLCFNRTVALRETWQS